jgi:hypothetical protein
MLHDGNQCVISIYTVRLQPNELGPVLDSQEAQVKGEKVSPTSTMSDRISQVHPTEHRRYSAEIEGVCVAC